MLVLSHCLNKSDFFMAHTNLFFFSSYNSRFRLINKSQASCPNMHSFLMGYQQNKSRGHAPWNQSLQFRLHYSITLSNMSLVLNPGVGSTFHLCLVNRVTYAICKVPGDPLLRKPSLFSFFAIAKEEGHTSTGL